MVFKILKLMKKFLNNVLLASALAVCCFALNSCDPDDDPFNDNLFDFIQGNWEENMGAPGETFYMISFGYNGTGIYRQCVAYNNYQYTITWEQTFTYDVDERSGAIDIVTSDGVETLWYVNNTDTGYMEMYKAYGNRFTLYLHKDWTYTLFGGKPGENK